MLIYIIISIVIVLICLLFYLNFLGVFKQLSVEVTTVGPISVFY